MLPHITRISIIKLNCTIISATLIFFIKYGLYYNYFITFIFLNKYLIF